MKLRVKIKNAKECRTTITFQDLCVRYSNGYSPVLKLNEGEEVPMEFLDPEDVKKSLLFGSLKAYLSNGWLEEIVDEVKKPAPEVKVVVPEAKPTLFVTEQQMLAVKHEDLPQNIPPMKVEEKILVDTPISDKAQAGQITDLDKVKSYEDFCQVPHLLKIRFIKESKNSELLKSIFNSTPSSQFKNNIQLRLSQIK